MPKAAKAGQGKERLSSPRDRQYFSQIDKLDKLKADLVKNQEKVDALPAEQTQEEWQAYDKKTVKRVYREKFEQYGKDYEEMKAEDALRTDEPVLHHLSSCFKDHADYASFHAWRDYMLDPEWLANQKMHDKHRDMRLALSALERRIESIEWARDVAIYSAKGAGATLIDLLLTMNLKSGVFIPYKDNTRLSVHPENKKKPEEVWEIAVASKVLGRIDPMTDEVCLYEDETIILPFLQQLGKDGPKAFLEWGKQFKVCVICNLPLTDDLSKDRGMGSVCYDRFIERNARR